MKLAFIDRRKRDAIESLRIESELGGDGGLFTIRVGGEGVRVVGDEVLIHPIGALLLIGQIGELFLSIIDELLRLRARRLGRARGGVRATLWRSLLGARMRLSHTRDCQR